MKQFWIQKRANLSHEELRQANGGADLSAWMPMQEEMALAASAAAVNGANGRGNTKK